LLPRAIQSVLNQSFGDFEIQIYDNASGDDTAKVAQAIASRDRRVKYFCHERNIGLIQNFAFGIGRVSTPFFNLLSDDDLLLPTFFETALRDLAGFPQAACFIGGLVEANSKGRVLQTPFESWKTGQVTSTGTFAAMGRTGLPTWTSMLFRTEILPTVGNLDPEFAETGDVEFESRLLSRYPAVVNHTPCAIFFIHPGSASANLRLPQLSAALSNILVNLERNAGNAVPATASRKLGFRFRDMVFSKAMAAAYLGQNDVAVETAMMLGKNFGSPGRASVVRLMSSNSPQGMLTRTAFRVIRGILRVWRSVAMSIRYKRTTSMVLSVLEQLELESARAQRHSDADPVA